MLFIIEMILSFCLDKRKVEGNFLFIIPTICLSCYDDTGKNICYDYGKRNYILTGIYNPKIMEYKIFELIFSDIRF